MSLQWAMKMYESQMQVTLFYGGDWSWTLHADYATLQKSLTATTISNEIKLQPSARQAAAAFMDEKQFTVLHESTWDAATSSDNYYHRLMHFIRFFVQGVIVYACMRGREEIAFCEGDEFSIIDEKTVSFQMKRYYKSCKLDVQYISPINLLELL